MTYDIESFLFEVVDIVKAELNNEIANVQAEKNDDVNVLPISNEAYLIQSMDQKAMNYNPIVFIGVTSIGSEVNYSSTAKTVGVEIVIILTENYDKDITRKLFRYQRAIENIFSKRMKTFGNNFSEVELTSLEPIAIQLSNTDEVHRAIGIEVTKIIVN